MRATPFALALAALALLPAPGHADAIADCNSDKPEAVIKGCGELIDGGKAGNEALAVAYFNRGNALGDQGDQDAAIADYTASIKLKPDYADTYLNRGLAYQGKKDDKNALADFTRAIAIKPDFARAYYARARIYEDKGDLKQALAGYEEAAKYAPRNKSIQKKIAEVKQKLGQ